MDRARLVQFAKAVAPRAGIFFGAFGVRMTVGAIFFGCVDMLNELNASTDFLSGRKVPLPYLPGVQYLIWIGGLLATKTSIPLTLGYKILPIVCDSLLAVVIYDASLRRGKGALASGILYALSPVAIIVSSVHAQWEPIFLLLFLVALHMQDRPERGWRFAAGFLFFLSGIVKPVPFAFAPFFLSVPRPGLGSVTYVRRELATIAGAVVCAGLYLRIASRAGYPVFDAIAIVATYVSEGYPLFGLPFAGVHLFENRAWVLPIIGLVALLYLRGKVGRYDAILLVFAIIIGTCGLAPQYLVWVVPFALITRRFVFLAAYTLVATAFQLMFYTCTLSSNVPYENLAAFAPLKSYAWLMPTILHAEDGVRRMKFVGNYAIPIVALGFVAVWLVQLRGTRRAEPGDASSGGAKVAVAYVCALALLFFGIRRVASWGAPTLGEFSSTVATKVAAYEVARHDRYYVIPRSYENTIARPVNAVSIGGAAAVLWSAAAVGLVVVRRRRRAR